MWLINAKMVITGNVIDVGGFFLELGKWGLWLQAIGIFAVVALLAWILSLLHNMKKLKEIRRIKEDINRVEKKIDKLLKRK